MRNGSLLGGIIEEMLGEDTKERFINKIHKDSGISKDKLNEVYSRGQAAAESSGQNPIAWAKARVYSFVEGGKESINESEGPFRIWDRKERTWVGKPYSNRKRATTRADKLDNEYGAYRYSVRLVHPDNTNKEISPHDRAKLDK